MPAVKRLDQLLSNLGYCSRREARYLLKDKRVRVAGEIAKSPSQKVDPANVLVDAEPLDMPEGILVMLNKPLGYVCSHDNNEGMRIYDLLPPRWESRNPKIVSVGRLDKDTTGLILITDDTKLVHKLTSPKHHVNKLYVVHVDRPLQQSIVDEFAKGVILGDGEEQCLPAKIEIVEENVANVTLNEGKYHQVRRMFAACGYHVDALHRAQFGEYSLGDLAEGEWRALTL
ncbi:pseudouridine synthase [Paraglaciecola sp. 20A4]|uniref:pseudouridine synthase n=1 Tax=Paraglaciecola sp. 20A4 TaxID=2687288 RepID=UPI0014099F14|nr:pseudouridine synthase [Paraglaciecola sp. 20A4]